MAYVPSDAEKLACAERELRMRRIVYSDRVRRELMPQSHADHEIALMRAILNGYKGQGARPCSRSL